jgi:hypothetical protein
MNQLSQNVDAPTCEVIVEHRIIDARTLHVKVQPVFVVMREVKMYMSNAVKRSNVRTFCRMSARRQLRRWFRCSTEGHVVGLQEKFGI